MDRVFAPVAGSVTIDLLANDHDGNGDSISILSFDAASNLGGSIVRSVGTGPGGRDQVSLQMIADHGQSDWFQYRIVDSTGRTATCIAYVQGENPSTKLTGTIIGTAGSWGNLPTTTKESAIDGNLGTFYDSVNGTGDWVGLDLGNGSSLAVTKINYSARSGQEGRMNGGVFQASNVPNFTSGVVSLFTVSGNPASGQLTVQSLTNNTAYRYVRYLGPTNGFCNVAEIEFLGAAPSAPKPPNGLAAIGVGAGRIDLSWNPSTLAASYKVYRALTPLGSYTAITTPTAITSTNFSDASLTSGTRYYYVVTGVNSLGESAGSLEASALANPTPTSDWRFNDGTGLLASDSSNFQNHGTINGATWVAGFAGTALQFNGTSSSVTFGPGPSISGTNNFTISAWIKTTATTRAIIIQQRDSFGYNGEYMLSVNANGTVQFMIFGDGAYQFDFATTQTIRDGAWHHVVAVRDGQVGRIFIDGNSIPAATVTGPAARTMDASLATAVGRDIRDDNQNFNGLIDEVRIFKFTALSGAEIQSLYNNYRAPVPAQITALALQPNGSFQLTGIGGNSQTYILRAASNLNPPITWTPLHTNTADATGAFTFLDASATNFPRRYYLLTTP